MNRMNNYSNAIRYGGLTNGELMFMDMMNYNSNGAPHGGFTHGGNGQDQFRQGNVGNGQPQLSQDNPSAGQQQMSQQRNGLRQIGRPHQQLSDPMASAQTVNNGTNVYNFYFVNSGQYGVNFSGSNEGPGIRSQGYPAFSQQSNTAVQQSVSGQFGGGNNEIPASVHPNQGFNPAMASAPRYHQPTVHGSTGAQTFNPTIASTPSMNRSGYHQLPFQHSSFQPSLSQSSLMDEFSQEESDEMCSSQCSAKSAPVHMCPFQ